MPVNTTCKSFIDAFEFEELKAARKAISLHLNSQFVDKKLEINELLDIAEGSNNVEFLIEIGEALAIGMQLPRDEKRSLRILQKGYQLDSLLGGYGLARFYFNVDKEASKAFFTISANEGHLISRALALSKFGNTTKYNVIAKIKLLRHLAIRWDKYKVDELRRILWRQTDEVPLRRHVERYIGRDRNIYLPYTVPLSLIAYERGRQSCWQSRRKI
jgi:hypothetical protein